MKPLLETEPSEVKFSTMTVLSSTAVIGWNKNDPWLPLSFEISDPLRIEIARKSQLGKRIS